ncbi:FAD-dependent oxidoreductase [Crossiella sp. NPDC003009]
MPLPRVVVVGAGIAGLTAAKSLRELGHPVTVREARDRVGGRIWTDEDGVDLGAHWIHGTDGDPITELVEELGVPFSYVGGDSAYTGGFRQPRPLRRGQPAVRAPLDGPHAGAGR